MWTVDPCKCPLQHVSVASPPPITIVGDTYRYAGSSVVHIQKVLGSSIRPTVDLLSILALLSRGCQIFLYFPVLRCCTMSSFLLKRQHKTTSTGVALCRHRPAHHFKKWGPKNSVLFSSCVSCKMLQGVPREKILLGRALKPQTLKPSESAALLFYSTYEPNFSGQCPVAQSNLTW